MANGIGQFSGLQSSGSEMAGIEDGANVYAGLTATGNVGTMHPLMDTTNGVPIDADGGGLAVESGNFWYYWTNTTFSLYSLDMSIGTGPRHGGPAPGMPYLVGIVMVDGVLYGADRNSDSLYTIDTADSSVSNPVPLCVDVSCPTTFDLQFGDLTLGP